jgi:exopolysaccharide production protein ExoQ
VPPTIAAALTLIGIVGLLWLDRDPRSRTSPALWIPLAWFLLACSRPLSTWFNLGPIQAESLTAQLSEGSPLDRAVLAGFLFLGIIVLLNRGKRLERCVCDSWPVLLFFGYCLLSLAWSDYPMVGFKRWNKAVGDWVMILIIWTDPQPIAAFKRLLARTAYVLVPVSILFVKYYANLGRAYDWLGEAHYSGVTAEKNTLGSICMVFGLASIWRILNLFSEEPRIQPRLRRLIVHVTILTMVLWLLSIADAMTSLACFLLATCALVAGRLRLCARNPVIIHVLILLLLLAPVSVALLGFSPETLQQMGRNTTLTDRTDIWESVIHLTPNRWLGAGFESFWLGPRLETVVSQVTKWWVPNQAHNGYLEIFANLGWIGVGCLGLVIFWGYCRIIHGLRRNLPAADLMLAYFLAGLIFNISEAAFFRMMIPAWLFFLIAITAPMDAMKQSLRKPSRTEVGILPSPQPELLLQANS